MKKIIFNFIFSLIASIFIGVILYYVLHSFKSDDSSFKQGFFSIIKEFLNKKYYNNDTSFGLRIFTTLKHFAIPFIFAILIGVFSGIIFSLNKKIDNISNYFFDFFRVLPSIVFIVILKYSINIRKVTEIYFDEGIEYAYFVVFISAIWPIIIATKEGVTRVNITSKNVISQLNLPFWIKLRKFTLPEASPNIFNGIRISIAIAYLIAITCEYITEELGGLGAVLKYYEGEYEGYYFHIIIIIIIIGIIGLTMNFILEVIENNILWLKRQYKTNE